MTWNYRIIKHDVRKPAYFAIHEVYYNDGGTITNWTADPINLTGGSKSELIATIKQVSSDSRLSVQVLRESELLKLIQQA